MILSYSTTTTEPMAPRYRLTQASRDPHFGFHHSHPAPQLPRYEDPFHQKRYDYLSQRHLQRKTSNPHLLARPPLSNQCATKAALPYLLSLSLARALRPSAIDTTTPTALLAQTTHLLPPLLPPPTPPSHPPLRSTTRTTSATPSAPSPSTAPATSPAAPRPAASA